ncbi:putative F-box protein PP2-B12 isoform X2 [Momordica charantia]|uniref:F-box protein PP2-B12 isoform X2 n=1 Tax=Momordica charantia TaxID=3673 RepID=A0A6J1DZC5_MOMCH|nr:putative F-box protein PP2-B12 isoform X2 [Momordica charantia]
MNFDLLPQDCLAHILSLASTREACRLSIVSETMHSMANSDVVWEKFLPFDCEEVLSRLDSPLVCSTKKELYLKLCCPHLIDGGKKVFYIDKKTSKKCYILGARELQIQWSNNPLYWSWNRQPFLKSRFEEVAELRTIWWLEIKGRINTKLLSPKTLYFAYLLVKFADRAYGLNNHPSQASVQLNTVTSQREVYLDKERGCNNGGLSKNRVVDRGSDDETEEDDCGWVKIELGEFYVNDLGDGDVEMCLKEVESQHLRGGLVVEGIQLRPRM